MIMGWSPHEAALSIAPVWRLAPVFVSLISLTPVLTRELVADLGMIIKEKHEDEDEEFAAISVGSSLDARGASIAIETFRSSVQSDGCTLPFGAGPSRLAPAHLG